MKYAENQNNKNWKQTIEDKHFPYQYTFGLQREDLISDAEEVLVLLVWLCVFS